jgi:hypothetical protein
MFYTFTELIFMCVPLLRFPHDRQVADAFTAYTAVYGLDSCRFPSTISSPHLQGVRHIPRMPNTARQQSEHLV